MRIEERQAIYAFAIFPTSVKRFAVSSMKTPNISDFSSLPADFLFSTCACRCRTDLLGNIFSPIAQIFCVPRTFNRQALIDPVLSSAVECGIVDKVIGSYVPAGVMDKVRLWKRLFLGCSHL